MSRLVNSKMKSRPNLPLGLSLLVFLSMLIGIPMANAFLASQPKFIHKKRIVMGREMMLATSHPGATEEEELTAGSQARRELFIRTVAATTSLVAVSAGCVQSSSAAVGSLPEFSDTNAILQGLVVNVADQSQQKSMIDFLIQSFDFKVLRQRIVESVEETWLGFGPEQLSIPDDFVVPVSSFGMYGGHAAICVRYDTKAKAPLYRIGDPAPGDNIAYLQIGVPNYRVSRMVANGGNILDAYGYVNVVSPSGLPMRAIVGIRPDPMMFLAINCENVQKSKSFYEKLGFVEQPYPFARPANGLGPFEPPQPQKSAYVTPSPNSMGILLLPSKKKRLAANPVLDSLNVVYTPSADAEAENAPVLVDPSSVKLSFQSAKVFEAIERVTR